MQSLYPDSDDQHYGYQAASYLHKGPVSPNVFVPTVENPTNAAATAPPAAPDATAPEYDVLKSIEAQVETVRGWFSQFLFPEQSSHLSLALVAANFLMLFCNFALNMHKPFKAEAIAPQFLFNVVLLGVPALVRPGVFFLAFASYLLFKVVRRSSARDQVLFF